MNDIFEQYRQLRKKVDTIAERLEEVHRKQMQCRQKCTDCCINLTVWPVEFYAILEDLKTAQTKPEFDPAGGCGFLQNGLCQIYPFRPIICRTHGLPLVYLDDEQDEPVHCVTFCEKNFLGPDADSLEFGPESTLDLDELNEKLALLYTDYLQAGGQEGPDGHGRIALSRLVDYL
jgi:Fe-S-cluster containining protein